MGARRNHGARRGAAKSDPKASPADAPTKAKVVTAQPRASFALRLFSRGRRYVAVRRELMEHFSVARSTAEKDIERAYALIAEDDQRELPTLKARLSARQWRIAVNAERDGKYAAASSALGRLAKLHGLEAPTVVEVEGLSADQLQLLRALSMTPVERQRRLAELEGSAASAGDDEP